MTKPRKINFYYNNKYLCSAGQYKTLKEALQGFRNNPKYVGIKDDGSIGVITFRDEGGVLKASFAK
jgi:hypothetical protein